MKPITAEGTTNVFNYPCGGVAIKNYIYLKNIFSFVAATDFPTINNIIKIKVVTSFSEN